jgi:fluoride exporter
MMTIMGFFAVGFGAAVGAWLRWVLSILLNAYFPAIPLGTLAANLLGAYVMGMVLGFSSSISPEARLLIATGFLGGLTTFSTFSAESVTLFNKADYMWMAAHILLHVIGSIAMTLLGLASVQAYKSMS